MKRWEKAVYKKTRAKINLTLNIVNKREDGYHNIESVFQKISLYDEMYVYKTDVDNGLKIYTNIEDLTDESNIIYKAYRLLKDRFSQICGVEVKLKKNIPMQAGLGGGSTDCGGFIECMNKLFKLNLSKEEMKKIGQELGADVPATFYNMPVIARGIGEIIEEIKSNSKYYIIIIKPEFSCNTKEMYRKLDEKKNIKQNVNTEEMKKALEKGDILEISSNLYNIFETAVNGLDKIKKDMIKVGAIGSLMSGSGSAIYGIFKEKEKAKKAYRELCKKYKTYFCISYNKTEKWR